MAYVKTTWVDDVTPLSAANLNKIEDALEAMLLNVYPVGSIYMSVNNTNPSTLFGGTWVAWGAGRVPVGVKSDDADFNSVEEVGGRKDSIVPAHNHSIAAQSVSVSGTASGSTDSDGTHKHIYERVWTNTFKESGDDQEHTGIDSYGGTYTDEGGAHTHTATLSVSASGTLGAHSTESEGSSSVSNTNLQPYITCYMWKRTA